MYIHILTPVFWWYVSWWNGARRRLEFMCLSVFFALSLPSFTWPNDRQYVQFLSLDTNDYTDTDTHTNLNFPSFCSITCSSWFFICHCQPDKMRIWMHNPWLSQTNQQLKIYLMRKRWRIKNLTFTDRGVVTAAFSFDFPLQDNNSSCEEEHKQEKSKSISNIFLR